MIHELNQAIKEGFYAMEEGVVYKLDPEYVQSILQDLSKYNYNESHFEGFYERRQSRLFFGKNTIEFKEIFNFDSIYENLALAFALSFPVAFPVALDGALLFAFAFAFAERRLVTLDGVKLAEKERTEKTPRFNRWILENDTEKN